MISVLLPFRNAASSLDEAVSSVLADLGPEDEIVLVDDGGADGGTAIAAAHAARDRRVVHVLAEGRIDGGAALGVAAALNRGLRVCKGELVARMDADDVTLRGRFAAQRASFVNAPELAVVATQVEPFGAAGPGIRRYVDWQNALLTPEDHARSIFVEAPVCHPSTMIRRSALEAVSGFREGPFAEDYDLWLRLVEAGWSIAKVPAVLFRWRIHDANTTWNDPRLSYDALRRLRADHLARRLRRAGGAFAMWGAGTAGRRLARELEPHGVRAQFFLDIDPRKIGSTRRGAPIVDAELGMTRARSDSVVIVVAVAQHGARDIVRARLDARGFIEGTDYLCAA